jgi:hypothetical protein
LTASLGVTGENNLNWSDYWGIYPINTYNIYRSNEGGAFKKIASVSASVKSFSDYEAPKGTNRYRIGIDAVTECNSAKEELNSNIVAFGILADEDLTLNTLSLSPNPAQNTVRINGLSGLNTIKIYTAAGVLVQENTVFDGADISIDLLTSGLYLIQVENKGILKLIKE